MLRTRFSLLLLVLSAVSAGVFVTSCNGNRQTDASTLPASDSVRQMVSDSTIYGVCGEAGMSTFCLIADSGDTIYLTRTAENGDEGEIWGDIDEGARFAMTMKKGERALVRAINLTQLGRFTGQYAISNGNLILREGETSDTVRMRWLNPDSLVVEYASGRVRRMLPLKAGM